jgi:hypothetical protein
VDFDLDFHHRGRKNLADACILEVCITEPVSYKAAAQQPGWVQAMDSEIASIMENHTWSLVDRPLSHPVVTARWVYKIKPGIT